MIYSYHNNNNSYSDEIVKLQKYLSVNNYLDRKNINGYFDLNTEKALKQYQISNNLISSGIYNSKEINTELVADNLNNNGVYRMITNSKQSNKSETKPDKNHTTFFNDDKEYVFRKSNIDVIIEYANSEKQKRKIEQIKIRSMSQVIDTSGEVIADVYQFLAKDIIEYNE